MWLDFVELINSLTLVAPCVEMLFFLFGKMMERDIVPFLLNAEFLHVVLEVYFLAS